MARVGSIACPAPGCGNNAATVSETGAGTLNISCHRCQFSAYGKAGTKAKRLIQAAMTPDEDAAPAASPKPPVAAAPKAPPKGDTKPPAAPAPAAAKQGAGFDLARL